MDSPEIVFNYFTDLTDLQKERISALGMLYRNWNEKINLISRKDIGHLYERHVLHSLGIAKVIEFKENSSILDVGTGGGFPGIPLAIMFPDCHFHLIDSIGKKINVVRNIVEELDIHNVTTEQIRAEQLKTHYDFIVSRAVTDMKSFYGWVNKLVLPNSRTNNDKTNGFLILKGGDVKQEINELKGPVKVYDLKDLFMEGFFETKKVIYLPINI